MEFPLLPHLIYTHALRVSRSDDGVLTAKLDSLDQGARDLPVEEFVHDGDTVRFASKRLGLSYTGTLAPGNSIIRGEMRQGGATMALNFERVASIPSLKRSQEPVKPYGYVEHEVRYTNQKDQAELAGTLTIPAGTGRYPAVVLITGSGAQDRDETIAGHRPFLVLADYLTRRGIAVLRADDRGVGASSAAAPTDTSLTYAGDVLAAIEFLKQRSDIAPQKIGLIGHSEGGMIAAIAAARSRDVAFIVMMAGIGQTGEEVILAQTELIRRKYGVAPQLIEVTGTTLKDVFQPEHENPRGVHSGPGAQELHGFHHVLDHFLVDGEVPERRHLRAVCFRALVVSQPRLVLCVFCVPTPIDG